MSGQPTCLDGGTLHSWERRGLDLRTVRGVEQLRRIRKCVWCDKERTEPYC